MEGAPDSENIDQLSEAITTLEKSKNQSEIDLAFLLKELVRDPSLMEEMGYEFNKVYTRNWLNLTGMPEDKIGETIEAVTSLLRAKVDDDKGAITEAISELARLLE